MDKFQNIKILVHLAEDLQKWQTQVLRKISFSSPRYCEFSEVEVDMNCYIVSGDNNVLVTFIFSHFMCNAFLLIPCRKFSYYLTE
jgi:hypothetical protein